MKLREPGKEKEKNRWL